MIPARAGRFGLSAPGVLLALFGFASLLAPFMTLAANRIVEGKGLTAWQLAGPEVIYPGLLSIITGLILGLFASWPRVRLAGAVLGLAGLFWLLSQSAPQLLQGAGEYARVSPGLGFWCLLAVLILLMADALTQLSPGPMTRLGLLLTIVTVLFILLGSGALSDLSIMKEYASRQGAFYNAALRHLGLAFGSLAAATVIGIPLGILCYHHAGLRRIALPVLSFLQTIPSLAMFGIMIPLLGWIASTVPAAKAIGIAGVGFAPAFLALLLYSLLPVVANMVSGLQSAPESVRDAARGMGMTLMQRLFRVELPLGLPVILAGLRIALVQNIGLAVIAGLIGGGGFGTFVFQGLNQTATDLILLGALPTVALALTAAIVMDVLVEVTQPSQSTQHTQGMPRKPS
ncbi:ABC transporter permease [Cocleimonas sp. KMM 6892]|uniref:ABC transporter permease n=1 Tax=unclassified Cocleimonas TaxID=2639732 RepID=UPI002DB5D9D5|nr:MULTISPECIES: ABC transporter permease [unclassified Cocleimonas]MEB8434477.1 ABC transporter permease [Cocleimonas sp. KMM 6892]MEC4717370.1 ABC transporter permease [Cocleimonas sp. KMM 6895]MEC4746749.1 ABC transporter permease [Cocleimonas sp. KMM 6896]